MPPISPTDGVFRPAGAEVFFCFKKEKLISGRLDKTDISPEKRSELMKTITSLPSEGIKTVYKRLVDLALDKTPDVVDLLQKTLSQGL